MNRTQDSAPLVPPPALAATEADSGRESLRGFWREWLQPILLIVLCMTAFRSAIADWNHVPSGSMKPTILVGDRIFVNKVAYDLKVPFTLVRLAHWAEPRRGDLVVFRSPLDGKRLVKRVIGLPGDVLEMRENRLRVNGEPVDYESTASGPARTPSQVTTEVLAPGLEHPIQITGHGGHRTFEPREIPAGRYFVMGDNRDHSFDSRGFGAVEQRLILGRAIAVALSVDPDDHYRPRWDRFFAPLP